MSTTMDQIHRIREMYYQQDKNISEIASETGFNWKTVKKYVDMEDFSSPPPKPASEDSHELFFASLNWRKLQRPDKQEDANYCLQ